MTTMTVTRIDHTGINATDGNLIYPGDHTTDAPERESRRMEIDLPDGWETWLRDDGNVMLRRADCPDDISSCELQYDKHKRHVVAVDTNRDIRLRLVTRLID